MTRILFIFIILILSLNARENPFFASVGEKDINFSSNENRAKEPLKRATITLPAQARILQKVTIEYKNLDGSIEKKSIELDNAVDWHLPVFISQNYSTAEKTTVKKVKKSNYKKIAFIKYAKFYKSNKILKIVTKDKMLRNFLLTKPHRIVFDFKRESKMKSYEKTLKGIFCKIRVGNHDGYYRAVVELDGLYRYKMTKVSDGYLFKLR